MTRTIAIAALALAAAAFALDMLDYKHLTHELTTELYIILIAIGFTLLGAWAGQRLYGGAPPELFERNEAALKSLGVTAREYEVLELLAAGQTNKEIARDLGLSPNTIKTHLSRLYEKLGVQRRTQAVRKAKTLALIP